MPATVDRQQIEARVIDALVEFGAERDAIGLDSTWEQIDVDSLDLVELAQIVEDEYGVVLKESDLEAIKTVGQAVDAIAQRVGSGA